MKFPDRHAVLAMTCAVLAVNNIVGPAVIKVEQQAIEQQTIQIILISLFIGIVLSQIPLLSAWTVLGPGTTIGRWCVAAAGVFLFTFTVACGVNIAEGGVDFKSAVSVLLVSVSGLLGAAGPFWIMAVISQRRIDMSDCRPNKLDRPLQFGLGHIMLGITVVSVLLVLIRFSGRPQSPMEWGVYGTSLLIVAVAGCLAAATLTMCSMLLVLSEEASGLWPVLLLLVTTVGGPPLLYAILYLVFRRHEGELLIAFFGISLGAATCTMLVLLALRLAGFQLKRARLSESTPDQPPDQPPDN